MLLYSINTETAPSQTPYAPVLEQHGNGALAGAVCSCTRSTRKRRPRGRRMPLYSINTETAPSQTPYAPVLDQHGNGALADAVCSCTRSTRKRRPRGRRMLG